MTGRSPISVPHHPAGRTEPQRGPESHRAGASRAGSGVGEVEGGQARGPSGAERVLMAGRGDGGGADSRVGELEGGQARGRVGQSGCQ